MATRAPERIRTALQEQWKRHEVSRSVFMLPFPPSVNRLWTIRDGGLRQSRRYETWARAAGNEINRQRPGRVSGPYELVLTVEDKPKKRPDLGNLEKATSDILQEHGIIDNDALCRRITIEWSAEMKGALVEVAQWPSSSLSPARRVA